MRALCERARQPAASASRSLHVVGTNGKSSVTRMSAALLEAARDSQPAPASRRTSGAGASGSGSAAPRSSPAPSPPRSSRSPRRSPRVEAALGDGERITQFEAAIAASFVALAAAGRRGRGDRGRPRRAARRDQRDPLDARRRSPRSASTTPSGSARRELEIAAEKLAVLREARHARRSASSPRGRGRWRAAHAAERGAPSSSRRATAGSRAAVPPSARSLPAPQRGGRRRAGRDASPGGARAPTRSARRRSPPRRCPGALEAIAGDPPLLVDAAHNEQGAARAGRGAGRRRRGAGRWSPASRSSPTRTRAAIVAALAPQLDRVRLHRGRPGSRRWDGPGASARSGGARRPARGRGRRAPRRSPIPAAAVARALELAAERGGVAVCAGSHYLLRYAWTVRHAQNCSR